VVVLQHFLKWIETARVAERCAAAAALARAFVDRELSFEEHCAAEAALTLLLDDTSWKVRHAFAEPLSLSRRAPLQVITALAADQPAVAAPVLIRSPLLTDADLVDLVAGGCATRQSLIAMRPLLSINVSAAIAEVGELGACLQLLDNTGAAIAAVSFRRMIERFGGDAVLREKLIAHPNLPSDSRHTLLVQVGETLKETPLVRALMGAARAEKLTRDACTKASLMLIDNAEACEHSALVEHLRIRGDLTTGFVIRAVAHGKIDFFGAVLVALSAYGASRVQALLAGGRDAGMAALLRKAGLPRAAHAPILRALKVWRQVARGERIAGPQEVSWLMLKELAAGEDSPREVRDFADLLRSIHIEVLRENARREALAIAAA
jgi:uncharacterized protein (DUF2336 family)